MELILFLRELKRVVYNLNELQIIINSTKNDLDQATRTLNDISITVANQDLISQLCIEKLRKNGYFNAVKHYFVKSAKKLAKRYGTSIALNLETTNVRAGVFKNGKVKINDDEQGDRFTLSYDTFKPKDERLIDNAAKNK